MSETHPEQVEGLEVNVVDDGYVIYQPDNDRVHYLNPTSALILELCDGQRDADAIAAAVAEQFSLATPPIQEVTDGVEQLRTEGVLA